MTISFTYSEKLTGPFSTGELREKATEEKIGLAHRTCETKMYFV
jgi:hypothetical protein